MRAQNKKEKEAESSLISATDIKKEQTGDKFPFLRIPDNPDVLTMLDEEIKEKTRLQEEMKKSNAEITDMMATLESLAPSQLENTKKPSKRKRSSSPRLEIPADQGLETRAEIEKVVEGDQEVGKNVPEVEIEVGAQDLETGHTGIVSGIEGHILEVGVPIEISGGMNTFVRRNHILVISFFLWNLK